ncbi:MAG TPA: hypothetical protein GXX46_13205, partial [Peptococcaceae bacterium]|nr:hypothetical protein [Peptococcaceae bacterium]
GEDRNIAEPICLVGGKEELEVNQPSNTGEGSGQIKGGRINISPIAKKLALENNIDYSNIKGTGEGGRIVKEDILRAIEEQKQNGINNSIKNENAEENSPETEIRISPLARKIAEENGIDYRKLKGTGPNGRILKEDVISAIQQMNKAEESVQAVTDESSIEPVKAVKEDTTQAKPAGRRVPLSRMRKVISRRLSQSKHDISHVYFGTTVDVTNVKELREKIKELVMAKTGRKLSLNDIIVKAVAQALAEHEDVNASLDNDEIVHHGEVNVGIAVSVDNGLVVPVIRNADKLSLSQINMCAAELIDKARKGELSLDDMSGGSFTVSNLGMYGIDEFAAIINPPESGILAVGKATDTPCVKNGEITVRTLMKLVLSVDHRLIDGALAAQFLSRIKELLENPYSMLI